METKKKWRKKYIVEMETENLGGMVVFCLALRPDGVSCQKDAGGEL